MNRYNWTSALIDELKTEVRAGTAYHKLASRSTVTKGRLFVDGKKVLTDAEIEPTLQSETETGVAPLGIRSLEHYVLGKYIGITRKHIQNFLSKDKRLQDMQFRPPTSKTVRKKSKKEGDTNFEFDKHPNCLGVDLVALGGQAYDNDFRDGSTHLIVVVHKFSSYIWAKSIDSPSASNCKRAFIGILRDARKKFGKVTKLQRDGGGEFKSVFEVFCRKEGVRPQTIFKVSYVERANSTLKRYLKFLSTQHDLDEAVKLALEKMRVTNNRITNKTPNELVGTTTRGRPKRVTRSWQGGRTQHKQYKKGDVVQYVRKIAVPETAVLYKSFNSRTWSTPTTVVRRHGDKYRLADVANYMVPITQIRSYIKPKTRTRKNFKAPERVYVPRKSTRRSKKDLVQLDSRGRVSKQTRGLFT